MDGLPGTNNGQTTMKAENITPLKKMVGPLAPTHYRNGAKFGTEHLFLAAVVSALFTAIVLLYGAQIASALFARVPADAKVAFSVPFEKLR